jgi:hypothetical protein
MQAKVQKLELHNVTASVESSIFKGVSVFVNGYTGKCETANFSADYKKGYLGSYIKLLASFNWHLLYQSAIYA